MHSAISILRVDYSTLHVTAVHNHNCYTKAGLFAVEDVTHGTAMGSQSADTFQSKG